ncbi:autophagy protein 16 [Heterostelium album PN500]|uniref:Autophagy protein 16 n=1 Tax=Heterostelium pallidum (strain ATCC 26659 / Pp 5 / PN500) TaxID=670386 RepID=D3B8K2_HETP5|nr:autophagy protein 16 [Heterostelium album PN500]EFA82370.1 autophagy protein 16 [Heterostelium album PN500]|eukprot:XP_020434487.1 autophagy protein 16 [Heterostelium album PN500]
MQQNNNGYTAPIISTASQSFNSIASWKQSIVNQLNQRNTVQTNAFSEIIKVYNDLMKRERQLQERNTIYEKEILALRNEKRGEKGASTSSSSSGSVSNRGKTIEELENKIYKLQEDLTLSYKTSADNASSLLSLNDKNKDLQNEMVSKEIELERVRSMLTSSEDSYKRLEAIIEEKTTVTQILKDELSALQSEFLHNESKVIKLEQENSELLERWIRKKNEEASKMNEANDFYHKMVEQREQFVHIKNDDININNISTMDVDAEIQNGRNLLDKQLNMTSSLLPSKSRKKFAAHQSEVYCLAFNSNGQMFASGSSDKSVKLWDALSCTHKTTLLGASQSIMSVNFSPNDEHILGTSNDNSARLWNVELGRPRHTLTGHIGKVYTGKFMLGSDKVVTGSHDRTIKLWDLQKGYCNRTIFCFSSCNDLVTLNTGSLIASGHVDHSVRFWDCNSGESVRVLEAIHEGQITSICQSLDPNLILTNSRDHTLKIIDVRTYLTLKTFKDQDYRNGLNWSRASWSPDGKYVAAGSIDGSICVWNALSGKTEKIISKVHNIGSSICCCAWSPLGYSFISGDKDKNIVQWE